MSGFITIDGANHLLNLMTAGDTPTGYFYVALIIGMPPGLGASVDELDEVDPIESPSYGRALYENISGNWSVDNGVMANAYEITFPTPGEDWGMIRYWALLDDSNRVLAAGALDPYSPAVGEDVYIPPGGLAISFDLADWGST